ncbi:lysosomal acid glucosylceramidase-like [Vespa mandarinia]|uniref:lysosomal acid glucosylceramidase-like n=1 Tax=Vespa mandarinia TaxID=7446 RepID=UPI00161E00A5|nr:lysosomal acid glucosylceramidase-like [Vespa mandarinia]XP_035743368.1 lysosomal acid glucosylceramidase-like [Vespa mandarinia]
MIYKTIFFIVFFIWKGKANDCIPRKFNYDSFVCVCNSTYCDSTPEIKEPEVGNYYAYSSDRDKRRLTFSQGKFLEDVNENSIPDGNNIFSLNNTIIVDRNTKYQKIQGFGGAFTDSAGMDIKTLSEPTQNILIKTYFDRSGSRYTLGRVPIGGSDFSIKAYTLDNTENDTNLEHFKLTKYDTDYKIPLIKQALKLSPDLRLTSAVWSPPIWMKTNNEYSGPGILKKEYYQTYAEYYIKFIQAYKSYGIDIWAVSTGNEPNDAWIPGAPISSMGWFPFELGNWIANNLGPTLARSEYNKTMILVLDDQRFYLIKFLDHVLRNKKALDYIHGIAIHWYTDEFISPSLLDITHNKYPNKFLLLTEACVGSQPNDNPKVQLGSWKRGEDYLLNIIQNLRHSVTGWIDWNLALNKMGGPNYIYNYVDSPIIVNPETDEFFKQPTYYAIKHFSRFVERDSVRIESMETNDIKTIAFETPSKMIVVVLYNMSSKSKNITIIDSKNGPIKMEINSYSIHTIIYK